VTGDFPNSNALLRGEDYQRAFAAAWCDVEPARRIYAFPSIQILKVHKPSA